MKEPLMNPNVEPFWANEITDEQRHDAYLAAKKFLELNTFPDKFEKLSAVVADYERRNGITPE